MKKKGFEEWETIGIGIANPRPVVKWTGTTEQFQAMWEALQAQGWTREGNVLHPPPEADHEKHLESLFGPPIPDGE